MSVCDKFNPYFVLSCFPWFPLTIDAHVEPGTYAPGTIIDLGVNVTNKSFRRVRNFVVQLIKVRWFYAEIQRTSSERPQVLQTSKWIWIYGWWWWWWLRQFDLNYDSRIGFINRSEALAIFVSYWSRMWCFDQDLLHWMVSYKCQMTGLFVYLSRKCPTVQTIVLSGNSRGLFWMSLKYVVAVRIKSIPFV